MKKTLTYILAATCLVACQQAPKTDSTTEVNDASQAEGTVLTYYGEEITPDNAVDASDLLAMDVGNRLNTKIKAPIVMTCRKMGCWMDVKLNDERDMKVYMDDHSFFVPKNGADGLMAYMEGEAYYDTLSVDFLKHLAEDAEASQEEIDAINEPQFELAFNATGVVIEGYVATEE